MKRIVTVLVPLLTLLVSSTAFAQTEQTARIEQFGWFAIASALAIGLAALGGTIGQGRAAAAALEGIARNPSAQNKIFVPFILAMALVESLVIFAFVVALQNLGNIQL